MEEKRARLGLVECVNHDLLQPYPVLHEKSGKKTLDLSSFGAAESKRTLLYNVHNYVCGPVTVYNFVVEAKTCVGLGR